MNINEDNEMLRFRVYENYTRHLADTLNKHDFDLEKTYRTVLSSQAYKSLEGGRLKEEDKFQRLIPNAWYTEIAVSKIGDHVEYIPFAIHWIPVQVYYSCFLMIRAFFLSIGTTLKTDHANTLASVSSKLKDNSDLFVAPWKYVMVDNPKNKPYHILNVNELKYEVKPTSPLAMYQQSKDIIGLMLKTTRERDYDKACSDYRTSHKKKKLTTDDKDSIIKKMRPTSLFDFMYRLRLRSNYMDADSFIVLSDSFDDAQVFYNSLTIINWYALSMFELLITKTVGKKRMNAYVNDFCNACSDTARIHIKERNAFYQSIV